MQGQAKDDEVYGKGNTYAYKYRMNDARINRFFSPDPLHFKYAYNSDYAFSENRLIDGVELEGLEYGGYMGANPWSIMARNFAQGFDASLNSIKVSINQAFSKISDLGSSSSGNTSYNSSSKTTNTTGIEYQGWDLFKPNAWTKNTDGTISNMPKPKIKVSNETTVEQNDVINVQMGNTSSSNTTTRSADGSIATNRTVETTIISNSGVPVTVSVSSSTNSNGTTNSAKVSVGLDFLNAFGEIEKSPNQTNTSIGVQSTVSTPSLGGTSIESETTIKATLTQ